MENVKVHFVAGKGGVGKTLVSRALASFFADHQKEKTLLVLLSEEESNKPGSSIIEKNLAPNLSLLKIFPDQTLYEYLSMKLPSKKMLDSFMVQSLFRALTSAMPGLSDLTRLGKIWFHADESQEKNGHDIYQKIVVDMPSSGFVTRFLSIARIVYDVVKIGPLAKEAKLIRDYFHDPNNACLHVVSMPEELVVNETIELIADVKNANDVVLGLLFINRVLASNYQNIDVIEQVRIYPDLLRVANFFTARKAREAKQLVRLEKNCAMPQVFVYDHIGEILDAGLMEKIKKAIAIGFKK